MCAENIWNPATGNCENGKYVGSIVDNSVITCDEVIVQTKTVPTRHVMKNNISTNFNILFIYFFNYHSIIDSCWYLLLLDKISRKTKAFITMSLYH